MNKHIAPIALSVGLLGIVGGVAAANAFSPTEKPAHRQVQIVQPASEVVTSSPTTTTAAVVTATVAPKPAPAPVESTTSAVVKKAPAPVQRQAVVSEPAPETTPEAPQPVQKPVRGNPVGEQVNDPYATPTPDGSAKK